MLPIRKIIYTMGDQTFVFTVGQEIEGGKKRVHEIALSESDGEKHCIIKIIDKNGSIITWDEALIGTRDSVKVQYDYNLIIDEQ